jgi:hypothetical protein
MDIRRVELDMPPAEQPIPAPGPAPALEVRNVAAARRYVMPDAPITDDEPESAAPESAASVTIETLLAELQAQRALIEAMQRQQSNRHLFTPEEAAAMDGQEKRFNEQIARDAAQRLPPKAPADAPAAQVQTSWPVPADAAVKAYQDVVGAILTQTAMQPGTGFQLQQFSAFNRLVLEALKAWRATAALPDNATMNTLLANAGARDAVTVFGQRVRQADAQAMARGVPRTNAAQAADIETIRAAWRKRCGRTGEFYYVFGIMREMGLPAEQLEQAIAALLV